MDTIVTVLTPAASFDLTVKAAVKTELGITDKLNDDLIDTLIHQASSVIAGYCGHTLAQEKVTETFRLDRALDCLRLQRWPVSSIASVVEDGTTLTAAGYELNAASGRLFRLDGSDHRFTWVGPKVVVTYTAGYALLTDLPEGVERCAIGLVKLYFFAAKRDPLVKSEEVPGVYNESFWIGGVGDSGAIPPDLAALLDGVRDLAIG